MAFTITQSFEKLRSNLEITDLQESTVSTRQQVVRAAIENQLDVIDSFLTGSYRRSTMIAPLKDADVDVFIVLDPKYYPHGQAKLLERTRAALRTRYKTPDISPNGQAVTIRFEDFRVDVVPGFRRKGGGFLIPDTQNQLWISTDPKRHVDIWSAKNKQQKGLLVPLLKMIKCWNREHGSFRSFHLEVLALTVFEGVLISDYPSGARYFFQQARGRATMALADPAGLSPTIAGYRASEQHRNITALDAAFQAAFAAEHHEGNGDTRTAVSFWQRVFGSAFPSYG
jgi:hypothetical protein